VGPVGKCALFVALCATACRLPLPEIDPGACPEGYVHVPPATEVGVEAGFCVAKYEMKQGAGELPLAEAGGLPWVSLTQPAAVAACERLGPGYALISNPEWIALAREIERTDANWYSGRLNRGHSEKPEEALEAGGDDDPCHGLPASCDEATWHFTRRTHRLRSGAVVWDLAGNVHEWVDWWLTEDRAGPLGLQWQELNTSTPTEAMPAASFRSEDEALRKDDGIGAYWPHEEPQCGAATRGGAWDYGSLAGIYTLTFNMWPDSQKDFVGFRCVWRDGTR